LKYLLYFALLYVLLPFNLYIDLISILIFYLVFNEDERFALIFSFFAGLLIDLFHPVVLGVNILIYVIFVQTLLYVKKYFKQNMWVNWIVFAVYYLAKVFVTHIAISAPVRIQPIIFTIMCFLPLVLISNKIKYKVWMRT